MIRIFILILVILCSNDLKSNPQKIKDKNEILKSSQSSATDLIYGRNSWIEIDLDSIFYNVKEIIKFISNDTEVMAVIKANAYGHGSVQVAKIALEAGATHLAVSYLDEAIELRKNNILASILVLGPTPREVFRRAVIYNITLAISSYETAIDLNKIGRELGIIIKIHINIDTGMSRSGISYHEAVDFIQFLNSLEHIKLEGIFSHFSTSDCNDSEYMDVQLNRFKKVIKSVTNKYSIPYIHMSSSSAMMQLKDEKMFNLVRPGKALLGLIDEVQTELDLKSSFTLKSRLSRVYKPNPGDGIGYCRSLKASGHEWIGTINLGFGDGFPRYLSNEGHALIKGIKVPIIGLISTDHMMLNITEAMPVAVGEEVILFGEQDDKQIQLTEVADYLELVSAELAIEMNRRLPRVYLRHDRIIEVINDNLKEKVAYDQV